MKAPPPRTTMMRSDIFSNTCEKFKEEPPGPYPRNNQENEFCIAFRAIWRVDFRKYGMPIPKSPNEPGASTQQSQEQISYLEEFAPVHLRKFGLPDAPAPPYPRDAAERREIFEYLDKYGKDLHRLESRGEPVWSLWFYVTDPATCAFLHGVVLFMALLFTLGCCTRITAPLIWFFNLNYLFRTPYIALRRRHHDQHHVVLSDDRPLRSGPVARPAHRRLVEPQQTCRCEPLASFLEEAGSGRRMKFARAPIGSSRRRVSPPMSLCACCRSTCASSISSPGSPSSPDRPG